MEKPTFTGNLIQAFILMLMSLSILHSHECCIQADIHNVLLYDAILAATYGSLFALKRKFANQDTSDLKRDIWLIRGSILLLLLLPHILCGINAPISNVQSATVVDNETGVALLELGVLEVLIHIWLGIDQPPGGNSGTKPKNKERVS